MNRKIQVINCKLDKDMTVFFYLIKLKLSEIHLVHKTVFREPSGTVSFTHLTLINF